MKTSFTPAPVRDEQQVLIDIFNLHGFTVAAAHFANWNWIDLDATIAAWDNYPACLCAYGVHSRGTRD